MFNTEELREKNPQISFVPLLNTITHKGLTFSVVELLVLAFQVYSIIDYSANSVSNLETQCSSKWLNNSRFGFTWKQNNAMIYMK